MPGFAIIGCGMIARFHVKALADIPGAKIVALADSELPRAKKLADELGLGDGNVYPDVPPLLARRDVDVVIVATPSGVHMDPAVAAANAGKHEIGRASCRERGRRSQA